MSLPELLSVLQIRSRLEEIFPEGTPNRSYFIREMAARTVFVMLYVGAVEGLGRWLGPKHVYGMSDTQAERQEKADRLHYGDEGWKSGFKPIGNRWYADTTREPIRDETLRDGLVRVGAVVQNHDLATTSSKPRYALADDFAALFDPLLEGESFARAVKAWQSNRLDPLALARIELLRQGAAAVVNRMDVVLPSRTVRQLAPGPSSVISKAVVEVFAPAFLYRPAVVLLSESGDKIVAQEENLISGMGLKIDRSKLLPDIILFDLELGKELLVFVEVVATDGPISESRRRDLLKIAADARISPHRIAFVTAYRDRSETAFKKTFGSVAWDTFVWLMAEPEHVVMLRRKPALESRRIFDLIRE